MKAIIKLDDVPAYQIGAPVRVYFPDSMMTGGVVELLKEQEAVKPRVDIDTWVCGNCGARIERQSMIGPNVLISETLDVCPNCGKKVKWDE